MRRFGAKEKKTEHDDDLGDFLHIAPGHREALRFATMTLNLPDHEAWFITWDLMAEIKRHMDDETAKVEISVVRQGVKKYLTLIRGLEAHGVKLKDASQYIKKTFGCGGTVSGESTVEIQGDIANEMHDLLVTKYGVPNGCIVLGENEGTKGWVFIVDGSSSEDD